MGMLGKFEAVRLEHSIVRKPKHVRDTARCAHELQAGAPVQQLDLRFRRS